MKIYTVNAFTDTPFSGNPAGVCILNEELTEEGYLKIASEINYPETAFVLEKDATYQLRWFTPTQEVDLCGHATLATAKVLYDIHNLTAPKIHFHTKSGILSVSKNQTDLMLDFPLYTTTPFEIPNTYKQIFASEIVDSHESADWCILEFKDEHEIQSFVPNMEVLSNQPHKVFVITAKSNTNTYDIVSRVFGPAIGIPEDPVTGSAHCYLAYYWSQKLNLKTIRAFQASRRTGNMICEIIDNNRVLLKGSALIMGEIQQNWKAYL